MLIFVKSKPRTRTDVIGQENKQPGILPGHAAPIIACLDTRGFDRKWGIGYS
jgi:hypothetical protein